MLLSIKNAVNRYGFRRRDIILIFASALLMALPFFSPRLWILTWVGLAPLFWVLEERSLRQAFGAGYVFGIVFCSIVFYWLFHLTTWFSFLAGVAVVLFILYLSLYFGLFGLSYALVGHRSISFKLMMIPSLWVTLEFIRGHFLTGFNWGSLAYAQYQNLALIQVADVTGMYGVSFLIVMVNYVFKEIVQKILRRDNVFYRELLKSLLITVIAVGLVLMYGFYRLSDRSVNPIISVTTIQPNISQESKWRPESWEDNLDQHIALTKTAAQEKPMLMIWPETSFPGFLPQDLNLLMKVKQMMQKVKIPIVFGSVTQKGGQYYNSAILFLSDAKTMQRYDKVHLVPFGEYLPGRWGIPKPLQNIIPVDDFTRGAELNTLSLDPVKSTQGSPYVMGILICFEDAVPELSRRLTQKGAQFLVNITNDGWFKDSNAPWMHVQSTVFRSVENRRSFVRSANTGVSVFIDPYGRLTSGVQNNQGKMTYVAGFKKEDVVLNSSQSLYTAFGDIFIYLCFLCILGGFFTSWKRTKNSIC
jgi:apolipoprotein N-acyltransferase